MPRFLGIKIPFLEETHLANEFCQMLALVPDEVLRHD